MRVLLRPAPTLLPSWPVPPLSLEMGTLPGKLLLLLPDPERLERRHLGVSELEGPAGDHQQYGGAGGPSRVPVGGGAVGVSAKKPSSGLPERKAPGGDGQGRLPGGGLALGWGRSCERRTCKTEAHLRTERGLSALPRPCVMSPQTRVNTFPQVCAHGHTATARTRV